MALVAICRAAAILVPVAVAVAACDDESAAPIEQSTEVGELRIVSLSPAISRTLVDLGLAHYLVGRSRFCRAVNPVIPVVGDLTTVHSEALIRVEPTHVFHQPPVTGVDPELSQLSRERGWTLGLWRSLNGVDDIEGLLQDLPAKLHPQAPVVSRAAQRRAQALLKAMSGMLMPEGAFRGTTLVISGLDPILAFGHDTYMHDILTRLGARNATSSTGWIRLSYEDVVRLAPEAIVLVLGMQPEDAPDVSRALSAFEGLDVPAARDGRLAILAHPDALLPSSGVVQVARAMGDVLRELGGAPK